MAWAFNNNDIIYYHIDAQWSIGWEQTYFTSSDYLVVQCWVCTTFFHPDTINVKGPSIYHCTKFLEVVVGYNSLEVPCT